jgi:hypothetical protein
MPGVSGFVSQDQQAARCRNQRVLEKIGMVHQELRCERIGIDSNALGLTSTSQFQGAQKNLELTVIGAASIFFRFISGRAASFFSPRSGSR